MDMVDMDMEDMDMEDMDMEDQDSGGQWWTVVDIFLAENILMVNIFQR